MWLAFAAVVLSGVVIALAILALLARRERRRSAAIAAWARARAWGFAGDESSSPARFAGSPFDLGRDRTVRNVVEGIDRDRRVVALDHCWTTGGQQDLRVQRVSVVAVDVAVRVLEVVVAPRVLARDWHPGVAVQDLRSGDDDFDQQYLARSSGYREPSDLALAMMRPDVREVMRRHPTLGWRMTDRWLVTIHPGVASPATFEAQLQAAADLLDRIPASAWEHLPRATRDRPSD